MNPLLFREPVQSSPFTPEFVHPAQFHPQRATSCEKRLLLAVLEEAITCVYAHVPPSGYGIRRAQRLRQEARDWFLSTERKWLFSFERICETLGYDPDSLRAQVLSEGFKLKDQGFRLNQVASSQMKIGVKEFLEA